ncbi:MAG TPA: hypothetical protein VN728_11860 [Stellaceae bacterium]|nr:hypothetical protein [Stellaceae bacterium]
MAEGEAPPSSPNRHTPPAPIKDDEVREFMTDWFGPGFEPMPMLAWSVRKRASLMGSGKSKRFLPTFRPFDLLAKPNDAQLVFENECQRIGVESVCGAQPAFTRYLDFNALYFQFAGSTRVETECGEYDTAPGELLLVPEGLAHRSWGTADSLRWYFHLHEPVRVMMDAANEVSVTEFTARRSSGPNWSVPADRAVRLKDQVQERMVQWRDRSAAEATVVERDYGSLVGATSKQRDRPESLVKKLRAFDCFTEITGQRGPGPKLIATDNFALETYNTVGAQFAFHRGLQSDEFGFQFAGHGYNLSELEAKVATPPGACALVPLGIAHSVLCDPGFLRFVAYSRIPWEVRADVGKHAYDSRFDIVPKVVKPHAWHSAKPAGAPHH